MASFQTRKVELEWRSLINANFRKPSDCNDLEQLRMYILQISQRMAEQRAQQIDIPEWVVLLLAQYNAVQNRILLKDFERTYAR